MPAQCRDCRYYTLDFIDRVFRNTEFARCARPTPNHPMVLAKNMVDGEKFTSRMLSCSVEREFDCGADAKFFQPR